MPSTAVELATYPVRGTERERPLLAAWVCVLASFLVPVIPLVPFVGYLVRVIDASDRDEPAPGFVREFLPLLRRGVGGTALTLVFLAGPFVVLLITVYGAMFGVESVEPGETPLLLVYAGSTVVLVVALVGAYLLPIALFRYGRTGSLRAAFSRKWLRGGATHAAYFAGWSLGAVLLTVGLGLASALFPVGRIGPPLAALVVAHASIVTCHVWGRAIARVHD